MTFDEAVELAREVAATPNWHCYGIAATRETPNPVLPDAPYTSYLVWPVYVNPNTGKSYGALKLLDHDEWVYLRDSYRRQSFR